MIQNCLQSFKDNIKFIFASLTTLSKILHILKTHCLEKHKDGSQERDNLEEFCKERLDETVRKIKEQLGRQYTLTSISDKLMLYWKQELEVIYLVHTIPKCFLHFITHAQRK